MTAGNRAIRTGFFDTSFAWEQFQELIEAMPDVAIAVDERGNIVAANAQVEATLGHAREALIGAPVETLLPEALHRDHRALRERYSSEPHSRPMGAGRDLKARRADAGEVPVDISLSPLLIAGRKIVLAALRDVTERRAAQARIQSLNAELEERVRQRTAELEAANRMLEEYSYTVSHELRSPLRIVRGFCKLLQNECPDDFQDARASVRDHVEHIADAAQRMSQIIEGLLALAHLDHHPLKCMPVDMYALACAVTSELRDENPARCVDFSVGVLPWAQGDSVLLHQVFANLLSNAVKYCGKRPTTAITVRGRRENDQAVYQVQDNGPGFSGQHAASLFDPFHRLEGADALEGLGIGLTLARRIVERHGGRIWAEGTPGGGATFSFAIPAADRDA